MSLLDRRLNAYRPDLADLSLRGQVEAAHFVSPQTYHLTAPLADIRSTPNESAELTSQALFGETVQVYDMAGGWAWAQLQEDGYVGYLRAEGLQAGVSAPTHRVWAVSTPLFPEPDLKSPTERFLYFWSQVEVVGERGRYAEIAGGGWLWKGHLQPLDHCEPDYVMTALRFLEAPYLWGGKSARGLDCSSLQQLALRAAGFATARDSDMQLQDERAGAALPPDATRKRGDLLFWKGHCAIALDEQRIVNATAGYLTTLIEPFADIDARARQDSPEGLLGIRRPDLG